MPLVTASTCIILALLTPRKSAGRQFYTPTRPLRCSRSTVVQRRLQAVHNGGTNPLSGHSVCACETRLSQTSSSTALHEGKYCRPMHDMLVWRCGRCPQPCCCCVAPWGWIYDDTSDKVRLQGMCFAVWRAVCHRMVCYITV